MQDTGASCSLPWAPCMGMPSSWELAARQLGLPYGKLSIWGERGGRGGSILVTSSMGGAGRLRPRGNHGRSFLSSGWERWLCGVNGGEATCHLTLMQKQLEEEGQPLELRPESGAER